MSTDLQTLPPQAVSNSPCKPFLKWVGGKSQLLPELLRRVPASYDSFFEPFLGGGALYFRMQPKNALLSDVNPELVNVYQVVQSSVRELIEALREHAYDKEYFYRLREADRDPEYQNWTPVRRASRLIYLNKTCFNGLFRVNARGHFNTPFGRYKNPRILDEGNLLACSLALRGARIELLDFESIESLISKRDFVYFDPPYVPLSSTSNFTSYAHGGFEESMQERLYQLCSRLHERGVRFLLSNSAAPWVLERYKEFSVDEVPARRSVNSKAERRGAINEVLVRNYGDPNDSKEISSAVSSSDRCVQSSDLVRER